MADDELVCPACGACNAERRIYIDVSANGRYAFCNVCSFYGPTLSFHVKET
jgi:formate dehydrogenase maturation protein FdhE